MESAEFPTAVDSPSRLAWLAADRRGMETRLADLERIPFGEKCLFDNLRADRTRARTAEPAR